jgi:hypothetical protein
MLIRDTRNQAMRKLEKEEDVSKIKNHEVDNSAEIQKGSL